MSSQPRVVRFRSNLVRHWFCDGGICCTTNVQGQGVKGQGH